MPSWSLEWVVRAVRTEELENNEPVAESMGWHLKDEYSLKEVYRMW